MKIENKAALIASVSAFSLAVVKFVVGFWTGSLAIISSALDSFLDMIISVCNFFILRKSQQDCDHNHNYGHGKLQGFGAIIEGLLIIVSAGSIFYFAIQKIREGQGIENLGYGEYVMILSVVVTFFLVRYLTNIYKKTGNLVIKSDIIHYKSDLLVNAGVFISLLVIRFTGFAIIDSVLSIIIAVYIVIGAIGIIREAVDMLMDKSLEQETLQQIDNIILNADSQIQSYHSLKTRKSGDSVFVEFHLVLNPDIKLIHAHEIGDAIESSIKEKINGSEVIIHFDPFDDSM